MKSRTLFLVMFLLLNGAICAQTSMTVEKVQGTRSLGDSRYGKVIWNNWAGSGWFSFMTPGYMWLDWGKLVDQGNLMPDEVVDGFSFAYATNATSGSVAWNMYFYDSCTGWGDPSIVQEAGFAFTGLPDATGLPPGYWCWEITVDLETSGYEFLLGYEIGIGYSLQTPGITCGPCLARPPLVGGNGNTMTEDGFDIYDPFGSYVYTWWSAGYPVPPYASFRSRLFGASDPSDGCSYEGVPLQGNHTGLYCVGSWAYGSYNNFLLRMNGMTQAGGVFFNVRSNPTWYAGIGKTVCPALDGCVKLPFGYSYTGDYVIFPFNCGPAALKYTWHIQGAITDWLVGGSVTPVDLSMDCVVTP